MNVCECFRDRYLKDFKSVCFCVSLMLFNLSFSFFRCNRMRKIKGFVLTCYIIQYLEAIYVLMVHAVYPLRHNHLDSILVCNHSTPISVTTQNKGEKKRFFVRIKTRREKKMQEKCYCGKCQIRVGLMVHYIELEPHPISI